MNPTSVATSRRWVPEIDGLRALAAIAVVLAHFGPHYWGNQTTLPGKVIPFLNTFSIANLAVCFFYSLSSFLLTYLCVSARDKFSIRQFYVRRVFRIWPLYFTVLIAISIAPHWLFNADADACQWISNKRWYYVTFLQNWSLALRGIRGHIDLMIPSFAVLWSIAVEEQFYLVFPLILVWTLRSKVNTAIAAVLFLTIAIGSRYWFLNQPQDGNQGMYYATTSYLDVFLFGGISGYIAATRPTLDILKKILPGIVIVFLLFMLGRLWQTRLWPPYGEGAWFAVAIYTLLGLLFGMLLLWVFYNRENAFCRVLRSRPMTTLGMLSFGIYMWHSPINRIVFKIEDACVPTCAREYLDYRHLLLLALDLALCTAFSAGTYTLIERPALLLSKILMRSEASVRKVNLGIVLLICFSISVIAVIIARNLPR